MKFRYGKNDWKTLQRGEENCYLMSNGLGGFSSLSLIGSCNRNDQAVLMACVHAPNNRYNMIHRLEERLRLDEEKYILSSQDYQIHEKRECGYVYQSGFSFEDYPKWTYHVCGVQIVKKIFLQQGKNTVGISYEIRNRSAKKAVFTVCPWMQFVKKGERLSAEQEFIFTAIEKKEDGREYYRIDSNEQTLYAKTNGQCLEIKKEFCDTLYYAADVEDGKMHLGRSAANHEVVATVFPGECRTLELIYGMEEDLPTMEEIKEQLHAYRSALHKQADFTDAIADQLAVSANQYISERVSTGKKTILAGFPFFEDWGRDTMISLYGCCLATRQFETAAAILETFMQYCHKGLMPNLFPEGTQKPWYNTVDAALLFILAVYEYEKKTQDSAFVKKAYPIMKDIISWYQKGTDFDIHMEKDGLIAAGSGYDQVTWMDVRVENILPTPRHGKPVEINAYWYNALCMMAEWKERLGEDDEEEYAALAEKVKNSFTEAFWNEEKHCLKDVVSKTKADDQLRCNQIWAVAQPFSVLSKEKEKQVVETVFCHLYTPYGLRTLSPEEEEFRPFYGGAQLDRDLAYHQGTVWTFPLGAYYLAYLKVNDYSEEAKAYVREQLNLLEPALWEGCVGQLPEIYDGQNPVSSKGCFAQAWSVAEILRVYDALR